MRSMNIYDIYDIFDVYKYMISLISTNEKNKTVINSTKNKKLRNNVCDG